METLDTNDVYAKKLALVATASRCYERGLQSNAGGNLSVQLSSADAIVIKPSGVGFNECCVDNLMVADLDGNTLAGTGKCSSDLDIHIDIYKVRPDIGAIVHVHSPWGTAWAAAGLEIPCPTIQAVAMMGRVPLIPLAPDGTRQTAREVSTIMRDPKVNAAILANHGTIGVGKTLLNAQYMVEIIEETAHISFVRDVLAQVHRINELPLPQV